MVWEKPSRSLIREFEKILKDKAYQIELHLNKLIPPKPNTIEETITETMRYALLNGGKSQGILIDGKL